MHNPTSVIENLTHKLLWDVDIQTDHLMSSTKKKKKKKRKKKRKRKKRTYKIKRETESLLIAAQDNAIRTKHMKVRIDKTQQNNKCRLCGDRDKTINHIISECSKLAQKEYKARHDWVSKVIH